MTEYITRENGEFKSYTKNEIESDIITFLKNEYEYIYQSIIDEDYKIEYNDFTSFFEITFENKVVGFYTSETIYDNPIQICINEFYVLPEFRGNKIFLYQLINLIQTPNITPVLRKPSRNIVDILIKEGLAFEFGENLIFTYVNFANEFGSVFVNNKVKKLYHTMDPKYFGLKILGNVYDYKHCTTIFNDTNDIFSKKDTTPCFAMPRRGDVEKYNLMPKLKKIDVKYVKKVKNLMKKNQDFVYEVSTIINENLQSGLTVENLIGDENNLHDYVVELLKSNNLSIEEGQEIRSKVQEALDEGEILPITIRRRFEYLLKNPTSDALVKEPEDSDRCPYCGSEISYDLETCETCGYNFYNDIADELLDNDNSNPYEREIDEKTNLEVNFIKTVDTANYDLEDVFSNQFEIACSDALGYIEIFPNQPLNMNVEAMHHIKDDLVIDYLLENDYIEQKESKPYEDEYVYKITKKGRRFYKQNRIANYFSSNLQGFDYYKFKRYYQENIENVKADDIVENYIQKLEKETKEDNNYSYYNQILINNLLTSRNMDGDKDFLTKFVKALICQLNEYYLTDISTNDNITPIRFEMENFMNLFDVINENYDLIELYVKAFKDIELDDLKINKEENLEIIQKLAETKDVLKLNFDEMEKRQKENEDK